MSRLALGTVQFGLPYGVANKDGQVTPSVAVEMLELAKNGGVDTLDTAISYGESESCLGEVGTDPFKIVTKLPAFPTNCPDIQAWVHEQMALSFARLNRSNVYGLLLHSPQQLMGCDGQALYAALQGLKEVGQVEKIGISIYDAVELDALTTKFTFDIVQAPMSLVDRRLHATGWLRRLKDEGLEVHARSIFLQGLLLMPQSHIPAKFATWAGLWNKWHEWLNKSGVSAVQACLSYALSFPEIDRVVVGADSVSHLEQILQAERAAGKIDDFPDIGSDSEALLNPARWPNL